MMEFISIALNSFLLIFLVSEFAGWTTFFIEWKEYYDIKKRRRLERAKRREIFLKRKEEIAREIEETERELEAKKAAAREHKAKTKPRKRLFHNVRKTQ